MHICTQQLAQYKIVQPTIKTIQVPHHQVSNNVQGNECEVCHRRGEMTKGDGNSCYNYQLSNLHIHHRLCRKSPRSICRSIIRIPQPTNYPIVIICTPCTIPEPNEGQDRQLDHIYPPLGHIYPLPLAHTIILDHFNQVPMESLPNVTSSHSNDSMQFPRPKHLPQWVNITLDLAGHPLDHNSFSIRSTHSYTMHVVSSHSYSSIYIVVTRINKLQGSIITS